MVKSALILALCAAPLIAQTERSPSLGDRVRVRAPKAGYGRLTGEVIATTPDVLQLRLDGGVTEVAVERAQIEELLLSLSSRRNTLRGAVIGMLAGAGLAYFYGPKKRGKLPGEPSGSTPTINIVSGTVGGAAIGGLAGHFTRSDVWLKLSPRR